MTANTLAVRRREIDAHFWTSEDVCELPSDSHRMMFVGLWCKADRAGRMEDKPFAIGLRVRPWDPKGAAPLIDHLICVGMVRRYTVNGASYLCLPSFLKYQRPNPHEARSRLPEPPTTPDPNPMVWNARAIEPTEITNGAVEKRALIGGDGLECTSEPSEPSEPSELKALSSSQKREPDATLELELDKPGEPPPSLAAVFEHWKAKTGYRRAKLTPKRARAVRNRLRDGYSVEELRRAVDGCLVTPHNAGQNERGERYDDLELICRDGEHVERFMRNAGAPPKARAGPDPNGGIVERVGALCDVCGTPCGYEFANLSVCQRCFPLAEAEGKRVKPDAPWSADLSQWAANKRNTSEVAA